MTEGEKSDPKFIEFEKDTFCTDLLSGRLLPENERPKLERWYLDGLRKIGEEGARRVVTARFRFSFSRKEEPSEK